jgi:hypothetical protein
MIKKMLAALVTCGVISANVAAQNVIQSKEYPKNVFRYPLDLAPSTAGSFGELRSQHFHSGLDFRTNQRTGYPIHAAFDGYISRLRVQFGGFGYAVYITHPNGYTTVYGHIERFSPEILKVIRDQQRAQRSFVIDYKPQPFQMQVVKGQVVAWSGNTGASGGPHLHFEIRDTETEQTINPQLFGLTIPDKIPPSLSTICIYHINGRPFDENTLRQYIAVKGAAGKYELAEPQVINLSGEIGFGITANDMNSTSANRNGVYSMELKLDGRTVYTFAVERFAFDQTHAINAHIDYPAFITSRRWLQKCFVLPGNNISLYPQSENKGLITFSDDAVHDVQYVVKDLAGNTSTLNLKVKSTPMKDRLPIFRPTGTLFAYNKRNEFNADKVKVIIPEENLYDNLDFQYTALPKKPGAYSATHRIHNRFTPVHNSYELWIKPDTDLGSYAAKAIVINSAGANAGGVYQDGYVKSKPSSFGDYYIRIDTVPPVIRPINIKGGSRMTGQRTIQFRMSDNLSGIKTYNGSIDGKWVLMEWDYKTRILSYTFDDSIAPGRHTFELAVSDERNNLSNFQSEFYR